LCNRILFGFGEKSAIMYENIKALLSRIWNLSYMLYVRMTPLILASYNRTIEVWSVFSERFYLLMQITTQRYQMLSIKVSESWTRIANRYK